MRRKPLKCTKLTCKLHMYPITKAHLQKPVIGHPHDQPLIALLIASITKFSIVIGSLHAYLSHNRHAITWVSNYRCLIWTFCNRTPVIGYPLDFQIYYMYVRFNGFLSNVLYSFQNLGKALQTCRSNEVPRRHF